MLRLGPAILNGSGVKDSTIPSFVIAIGVEMWVKTSAGVR